MADDIEIQIEPGADDMELQVEPRKDNQLEGMIHTSEGEGVNLAMRLDDDKRKEIAGRVVDEYDSDLRSRTDWDLRRASWLKLFSGYRDPKSFPWANCSSVHIPLMGIASLQFQARAYEALVHPKEVVRCFSTDGKTVDAAERATRYMNYQLLYGIEEWEEEEDLMLLLLPIFGSAYKKTYFDATRGKVVSRCLNVDEFVTPYRCRRIEDAPRKTHVFWVSTNDLKIRAKNGVYLESAADLPEGTLRGFIAPMPQYASQADKVEHRSEPSDLKEMPRMILEQHRLWDLDDDGIQEPYVMTVDYESRELLSMQSRLYVDSTTGDVKTLEYFTAYTFIPNPESHYGFGFGHLLEGLNEAANTIINQLVDAGTLSNLASGFVSKRSGIKKGQLKFKMGEFQEVDALTDDIAKAIYQFKFPEPSQALFALLKMLEDFSQGIASLSEGMMGKFPPSDTTATTMLAVMEQGLKVFSTIHKRLHRAFKKELQKIFLLNGIYLDEPVYFTVQDSTSSVMQTFQAGHADFANNIDVIPASDPNITSRAEKLIKAKTVYEIAMQNPLVNSNPEAMYRITKQLFEANEVMNVDQILQPPQPPPPPPDESPEDENAKVLAERQIHTLPEQDHLVHAHKHGVFADSVWGKQLTPQGKELLNAHIREHMGQAYLQETREAQESQGRIKEIESNLTGNMERMAGV